MGERHNRLEILARRQRGMAEWNELCLDFGFKPVPARVSHNGIK